jgi:hypothetical protein
MQKTCAALSQTQHTEDACQKETITQAQALQYTKERSSVLDVLTALVFDL